MGHSVLSVQFQGSEGNDVDRENFLHCDSENIRRQKFKVISKMQEEINGLIKPRKDLVVLPGMFLPQSITSSASASTAGTTEQEPLRTKRGSPGRNQRGRTLASDSKSTGPSNPPRARNGHRNSGARKNKVQNARNRSSIG